jgi:hypothetical protein
MQDNDIVPIEDQTMTILKDHYVCGCNLDDDPPFCIVSPKDEFTSEHEKKVLIPKSLAYYLRTHWCGSYKMNNIIEEHGKSLIREQIKDALGL